MLAGIGRMIQRAFCQFKHYKEIADHLKMPVPKINEEIGIEGERRCWLIGYEQQKQEGSTTQASNEQGELTLVANAASKLQSSFSTIQSYALKHSYDICLINPQNNELTLMKLKEAIYRKYFQEKVFKSKSLGRKYKEMRIPQNIQQHDLVVKTNKVKSMIKKGEHIFKIYSANDSEKCKKSMMRFCEILGREQYDLNIEEHEVKSKTGKKSNVKIQRWTVHLNFKLEAAVDYEKVNRKWRRFCMKEKLSDIKPKRIREELDHLSSQSIEAQREILADLRAHHIPLPSSYRDYEEVESAIEEGGFGSMLRLAMSKHNNQQSSSSQSQSQSSEQSQEQEQKDERKFMNLRTVEDILSQMQALRGQKHELGAYQSYRMKQLQKELKQTLKRAGYKGKF